jgi:DNA-binding MarR family transcriptional regulator
MLAHWQDVRHSRRESPRRCGPSAVRRGAHGSPVAPAGPEWVRSLATIERHGPLTLGDLAAREQVAPPTITKVVEKLELNGFVARTADISDRRCTRVAVTPNGAEQLQAYRTRRTEWLTGRLAALSDDQRAALAAALPVLEQLVEMPEAAE